MNELRILTVRQPWAWAIIHGGKDVENRVRNIAGGYRGPVAILAGRSIDEVGQHSPLVKEAWVGPTRRAKDPDPRKIGFYTDVPYRRAFTYGAIIGVVDLRATHHAEFCADEPEPCSPWAEPGEMWHLELVNPRPLTTPIPYRGALGLRRLDEKTTAAVWSQIGEQR